MDVLWCHSHLVWLVFIPTCACFHSENFVTCSNTKQSESALDAIQLLTDIRLCIRPEDFYALFSAPKFDQEYTTLPDIAIQCGNKTIHIN